VRTGRAAFASGLLTTIMLRLVNPAVRKPLLALFYLYRLGGTVIAGPVILVLIRLAHHRSILFAVPYAPSGQLLHVEATAAITYCCERRRDFWASLGAGLGAALYRIARSRTPDYQADRWLTHFTRHAEAYVNPFRT